MTIYKFTRLTLPPTLEKRRDVLEAFRTLVDQDDKLVQQRRAEIAAIRVRPAGWANFGKAVLWTQNACKASTFASTTIMPISRSAFIWPQRC